MWRKPSSQPFEPLRRGFECGSTASARRRCRRRALSKDRSFSNVLETDKLKGRIEQSGLTVTAGYAISCDLYKRRYTLRKLTQLCIIIMPRQHFTSSESGAYQTYRDRVCTVANHGVAGSSTRASGSHTGHQRRRRLENDGYTVARSRRIVGPSPSLQGFDNGLDPASYSSIREAGSRSSSRRALTWHDEGALIMYGDRLPTAHHRLRRSDSDDSSDNPFLPGTTFPGMRRFPIPMNDRRYAPPAPTVEYVYLPHPEPSQVLQMCNSRGCNELTSGLLRKDQVTRRGAEEVRSPVEYVSSMCGTVSERASLSKPFLMLVRRGGGFHLAHRVHDAWPRFLARMIQADQVSRKP